MHCKRKAPKERVGVKRPCTRDRKLVANALLMLLNCDHEATEVPTSKEIDAAEMLLSMSCGQVTDKQGLTNMSLDFNDNSNENDTCTSSLQTQVGHNVL